MKRHDQLGATHLERPVPVCGACRDDDHAGCLDATRAFAFAAIGRTATGQLCACSRRDHPGAA